MSEVHVRPMLPGDADAAARSAHETFVELDTRLGEPVPPSSPQDEERRRLRAAHLQRTDPDGAYVAEQDGRVVGVTLAIRRGPLWFLSLLTVAPHLQGLGVGARLLTQALRTAEGAGAGWILSSDDPRALRRYALAGFAPVPAYTARGKVDRSLLPAVPQVRDGDWDADADLVEAVALEQRGAAYGPDLEVLRRGRLLVTDGPDGRGFVAVWPGGVRPIGATTPKAAQALLWAALAEVGDEASVEFLTGEQQWAIDVLLRARLALHPGSSTCHRGRLGPFSPYLPSGAYG